MKDEKTTTPIIQLISLIMFVGGAVVTALMVAQAFALKGTTLAGFFVLSCTAIFGVSGVTVARSSGENAWSGGAIGGCLGALISVVSYFCTRHYSWWQ